MRLTESGRAYAISVVWRQYLGSDRVSAGVGQRGRGTTLRRLRTGVRHFLESLQKGVAAMETGMDRGRAERPRDEAQVIDALANAQKLYERYVELACVAREAEQDVDELAYYQRKADHPLGLVICRGD